MGFDNTYVQVNLDTIVQNFEAIQKKAGVPVMAVIKANAYGHGAVAVARLLRGKCGFFGVSSMSEALELRKAGIDEPILVFGRTAVNTYATAVEQQIRLSIFRYEDALALSNEAAALGMDALLHLAADTGMSRIGFEPNEQSADLCQKIAALPNLKIEGLFSHFATAGSADRSYAREQAVLFDRFCQMLKNRGLEIPICHMDNSGGLIHFDHHYDMVRAGIVLYGMYPSAESDTAALTVSPALQWFSRVAYIKDLPAGRAISYGATYVTPAPMRIATIPVGYADGYCRSLSNRFHVLIRGRKAPILGRICMDQLMVDVTQIPDAALEDTVTLVGHDGDEVITMEDISAAAGSFNYEFVSGIARRVPRQYFQNGAQTAVVNYLLD